MVEAAGGRRIRPLSTEPVGAIYGDASYGPVIEPVWPRVRAVIERTWSGRAVQAHEGCELRVEHAGHAALVRLFSVPPGTRWVALVGAWTEPVAVPAMLTPRQRQVFQLACLEHRTNGEIAEELGVSEGTVRNHLKAINAHLRAEGRGAPARRGRSPRTAVVRLPPLLGKRQLEIARLVVEGKTNAEVGQALGLTAVTIGCYLTKIYRALGVRGRHGLAAKLAQIEGA